MWKFGETALPETRALASVLRRLTSTALSLEVSDHDVRRLVDDLEDVERRLEQRAPADPSPRIGDDSRPEQRVYLDHSSNIGDYNPCFPVYDLTLEDQRAVGTVGFPIAYEGPPGLVHGGFLAVFFDAAIQHHNCALDLTGKTTSLAVRFRRPTPLLTELRFEIDRSFEDNRICSEAQLFLGDQLLCEAEMRAVPGSQANLPKVSPRRSDR